MRFSKETEQKVDLAALGRAKRRLRQIVEEGKSRKRISSRTRIARYEHAGKSPSLRRRREDLPRCSDQSKRNTSHQNKEEPLPTQLTRETTELLEVSVEEGWSIEIPESRVEVDD